ncbi:membrane protein insertase YidC [Ideonella sp. B7]|uniref:membrane protein insertase YidC n=1 Tax=Ideonella benzenivorans TaxID=2831643 RepID=UPI001CEE0412|nr:membrane protein insertase YidC [Ideonella benzenivorans]MCA6218438.1 membrane protein insertase YidC [Ideonella benzenivorans]
MTDMRRTLLWVVFTMSLVLLWDAWSRHNGQPTLFGGPVPAASAAASGNGGVPSPASVAANGAVPATPGASAPAAVKSETFTVRTDVMTVTFDTLGGTMARVALPKYHSDTDPKQPMLVLDETGHRYEAQTGYISAGATPLPTHLTVMSAVPGERELKDGQDTLTVRFESPDVGGAKLVKTYTFHRGQYTVDVKQALTNVGSTPLQPQLYLQLQRNSQAAGATSSFYSTFTGPAVYSDEKRYQKVSFDDIAKHQPGDSPLHVQKANDGWIAMVQHYFATAWLVKDGSPREFRTTKIGPDLYTVALLQPLGTLAPGATQTNDATLFVGPQEEKKLATLAPGLELVKDYGWFKVLSEPLFWVLDQLYKFIGNWGWSIILLVVLLKIAFYWLNAKAYQSMAKMKAVNPRIMELRERLKDKPQEMQQEMMRIYREEKVNPLGGCLPIFIQMPFFMALYWVLMSSVEMRGAPWIGWITDLAAKDPYFILPALMTLSSLLQVWLSPKQADPMQQKMMWIMPLAFSFMFFFFPSGLVLYWLTNNLLSIAQQYVINKRMGVL